MSDLLGDKTSLQEKVRLIVQNYALRFPQHSFDADAEYKRLESYIPRITPMIKVCQHISKNRFDNTVLKQFLD